MKTWVIILILLVVVFVIVPLIYFTVIVRNADKFVDNSNPSIDGRICEQDAKVISSGFAGGFIYSDSKGICKKL
jgi:hypothetical protein